MLSCVSGDYDEILLIHRTAGWSPASWSPLSWSTTGLGLSCGGPTGVTTSWGSSGITTSAKTRRPPDAANPPAPPHSEPYKTHLAYVKERRSDSDGAAILAEALDRLRRVP